MCVCILDLRSPSPVLFWLLCWFLLIALLTWYSSMLPHRFADRRLLVGSGGQWTHRRMPTTRTRRRWWSVWTVWSGCCSGWARAASTASRHGRRAGPRASPPPPWCWTTASAKWLTCRPDCLGVMWCKTWSTERYIEQDNGGPFGNGDIRKWTISTSMYSHFATMLIQNVGTKSFYNAHWPALDFTSLFTHVHEF